MKEKKNGVENLQPIGEDSTQTKGKVVGSFTIVDDTTATEQIEKESKNEIFSALSDYFCPVRFDDTILRNSLQPLKDNGIMSEEVFNATISKAKQEFLKAHDDEIKAGENLSFGEVIAKLKENESLYKKVLQVCNISSFEESNYIVDGKVKIYRANQFVNNDGTNRYFDVTLKREYNGKTFEQSLFVESREITTSNILLSIRYYSAKQESAKRLNNQINEYKRVLSDIYELAQKAKDKGFSKTQILAQIENVFA